MTYFDHRQSLFKLVTENRPLLLMTCGVRQSSILRLLRFSSDSTSRWLPASLLTMASTTHIMPTTSNCTFIPLNGGYSANAMNSCFSAFHSWFTITMCLPAVSSHSSVLSAMPPDGYGLISAAVSSSCVLTDTRFLWPSGIVAYRRVQCSARCCSLPSQLLVTTATPTYLSELVQHHLGLCTLPMLWCSLFLTHTELACRAFSVAAPSTWNSLPADIRLCENILTFKHHLKIQLFKLT